MLLRLEDDARMDENPQQESARPETIPQIRKRGDPEILARLVIRENKPFKHSAIQAGYSAALAGRGLGFAINCSAAIATAVEKETKRLSANLAALKPIAIQRLYDEIVREDSAGGLKAIEIAGRFKETDWFVRSVDVQVGVFAAISADAPIPPAEPYKDDE